MDTKLDVRSHMPKTWDFKDKEQDALDTFFFENMP
jgi:hypothetical protein